MSQVQHYKCEVCGLREREHSHWLLMSDQPRAHNIDVLSWDDKLAAQPGICHLCCADHMQELVGMWMMSDLGIPPQIQEAAMQDRTSLLANFDLDRLSRRLDTDRESLLAMLQAVEVAVQGFNKDEEDPALVFDA